MPALCSTPPSSAATPRAARCGAGRAQRRSPLACAAPRDSFPHAGASEELCRLLDAAVCASERAARACLAVRATLDEADAVMKIDSTPVSVADFAAQALVGFTLAPFSLPLVAEESGDTLRSSPALLARVTAAAAAALAVDGEAPPSEAQLLAALGGRDWLADTCEPAPPRHWVLDPIDGTRGFLAGGEAQYAVGLALMEGSETLAGVLVLPNWPGGALLLASLRGSGAWARPLAGGAWRRLRCGDGPPLLFEQLTLCVSDHERWAETPLGRSCGRSPAAQLPLCCGSLVKYAAVALGRAHAFVQHPGSAARLKSWDHAAGVALVREAGGAVLGWDGAPLLLSSFGPDFHPPSSALLACAADAAPAMRALLPPPERAPRLILLDRDGTVNEDVGPPGVLDVSRLRLEAGAREALRSLRAQGLTVALVTNQSAVGKGLLSPDRLQHLHLTLRAMLDEEAGDEAFQAVFVSFDKASGRHKPSPQMLLDACARFGVSPTAAVMVGDTVGDMKAAAAAGVPLRMLICSGHHGRMFGVAAATAGLVLPLRVVTVSESSPLASLLPASILPLELHASFASASAAVLAARTSALCL